MEVPIPKVKMDDIKIAKMTAIGISFSSAIQLPESNAKNNPRGVST
jgi:hypothetical protein